MAEKKLKTTLCCRQCGGSFTQMKTWQFFCSSHCRNLYHSSTRSDGQKLRERIAELEQKVIALGGTL